MLSQADIDYGFDQNDVEELMDSFSESLQRITLRKVLLNDNRIMCIYSDNTEEKTLNVYPENLNFDPEVNVTEEVRYSQIQQFL